MTKLRLAAIAAVVFLATAPCAAWAYQAYLATDASLLAGPSPDYPVVAQIPGGTDVDVLGCLPDYRWCDVVAMGNRGWLYAGDIDSMYQNEPVPLLDYGPVLGIGIIPFAFGPGFDGHFHDRRPFRDRHHFIHGPRPVQPPLPPRPFVPPRAGFAPPAPMPRLAPRMTLPSPGHIAPPRSAAPGRPPMMAGEAHGPHR